MFGTIDWRKLAKTSTATLLMVLLSLSPIATQPAIAAFGRKPAARTETTQPSKLAGKLTEVAPPVSIQELRSAFEDNQPQVAILSPRPNEVLTDNTVLVKFQVRDLSLFKNKSLGLGPHLHVFLDNQPYQAIYDPSQPLVLDNLAPGTHTVRAFASRPWHESFKNEGAYAQTTFHIFTQTDDNRPDGTLPLLTYSRPQAVYGAEPIMLDFYLTNAPLHLVAKEDNKDDIADWRIRCTINGDSFILDQWQPVWLKGFKPGKNWVQLEFLDENGQPVKNAFNNTVRLITYEPGGKDTLSQLVRGELNAADARGIVDANYKPPVPAPSPTPSAIAKPEPSPSPSPTSSPLAQPSASPAPVLVAPVVKPSPTPAPSPSSAPLMNPAPVSQPAAKVTPTPKVAPTPGSKVPAAIAPTPPPTPEAKPAKSPVQDLLSRFRKEPPEKKSVSVPVVPPPTQPAPPPQPATNASPKPVTVPQTAEQKDKSDAIDSPQPTEAPKGEAAKTNPSAVEVPATLTAPAPAQAVDNSKNSSPNRVSAPPASAPAPESSPPQRPRPE